MSSLICARINSWVNNGKAGDLRRHRAHYDVIVMIHIIQAAIYTAVLMALCEGNVPVPAGSPSQRANHVLLTSRETMVSVRLSMAAMEDGDSHVPPGKYTRVVRLNGTCGCQFPTCWVRNLITVKSLIKVKTRIFLLSSYGCFLSIHWSQVLSREWRCSWSSADRRLSNYIWMINNFIVYESATYVRESVVTYHLINS